MAQQHCVENGSINVSLTSFSFQRCHSRKWKRSKWKWRMKLYFIYPCHFRKLASQKSWALHLLSQQGDAYIIVGKSIVKWPVTRPFSLSISSWNQSWCEVRSRKCISCFESISVDGWWDHDGFNLVQQLYENVEVVTAACNTWTIDVIMDRTNPWQKRLKLTYRLNSLRIRKKLL